MFGAYGDELCKAGLDSCMGVDEACLDRGERGALVRHHRDAFRVLNRLLSHFKVKVERLTLFFDYITSSAARF